MHPAFLNAGLQIGMAVLRYALQLYAFKHIPLETVGKISLILTFVTSATFIAGFELHQHLNRPLLLGEHGEVRGVCFRLLFGSSILLILAMLFPWITDIQVNYSVIFLIFITAILEYINLELGRILIIRSRYLLVASFGALRALAPFLPGLIAPITLVSSLSSWLIVSLLSGILMLRAILADQEIERSPIPLNRMDIVPTIRFFLIGGVTALLPLIERLCISRLFGLEALGTFALLFMFVGVGDLLMQGLIWQPFVKQITYQLSQASTWIRTAIFLLIGTVATYSAICITLLVLASYIFATLNKPMPDSTLIIAVLLYGAARSSFTICFQTYYSNRSESVLPYIQISIAAAVLICYYLGAATGMPLSAVLIMAAIMWVAFPALAFIFRRPTPLQKSPV